MAWGPWNHAWRPTQMADPPMAVAQEPEVSDDEDLPPPSFFTGLSKQVDVNMTVGQLAQFLFGDDITDPCSLRILNNSGERLHYSTQAGFLTVPRMIYFQTGSLTKFEFLRDTIANSTHDLVLTRETEARLHVVSCRVFATYVPVWRALDQNARLLSMQSTINDNLEQRLMAQQQRIADLEATVARLQQQIIALTPVVIVPEPETEIEPPI